MSIPRVGEWLRRRFKRLSRERATDGWKTSRLPLSARQNWHISNMIRMGIDNLNIRRVEPDNRGGLSHSLTEVAGCIESLERGKRFCVARPGRPGHSDFVCPPSLMLPSLYGLYSTGFGRPFDVERAVWDAR